MRCYNGCPDSKLQSILDSEAKLQKELKTAHPEARCVYFPNGDFHIVFVGVKGLWNTQSTNMQEAIRLALEVL